MIATFKRKWTEKVFNISWTYLEYEYRGHRYVVEINNSRGNEPLSWQHRNAQARIDRIIEMENSEKKEIKNQETAGSIIGKFLDYCEGITDTFE